MSSIQKPKYFMGLQHWEGQSPGAVFVNACDSTCGLALFRMPSALCTHPNPQHAAPTENCPDEPFPGHDPSKTRSTHAYFISYNYSNLFRIEAMFQQSGFSCPMFSVFPFRFPKTGILPLVSVLAGEPSSWKKLVG